MDKRGVFYPIKNTFKLKNSVNDDIIYFIYLKPFKRIVYELNSLVNIMNFSLENNSFFQK